MGTNTKEAFPESKEFLDRTEELGNLSGTIFEENGKICNADPLEDALLADPDCCGLCGNPLVVPRMLFCLHVFCEGCIDKKFVGEGGDAGTADTSITCPTCSYVSKVGVKKMAALPLDVTKTNISDVSNVPSLYCTSCTAKEVATSRCSTCHNLLCNNCESAHHYMRCFETHEVVALEDMRKDGIKITVHKPLICDIHPGENVIFYCTSCRVTACAECSKTEHQNHPCEGILDSEVRVRQEMESLLSKSKDTIEALMKSSSGLNNSLEELAHQRTTAKDLINETYQSYKAILEKSRDDALEELNKLYRERELKIMKDNDEVGRTIDNFEDACKYTARLLETGTVPEMMYLRKTVSSRLSMLNGSRPKIETTFNIEFRSDFEVFENMVKEHFGKFTTEAELQPAYPPISSNVPDIAPIAINGNGTSAIVNGLTNGCGAAASVTTSSPISLPASMQSSFEGDLTNNMQNFAISSAQSPPLPPQVAAGSLQGFNTIAEYNLAQLASLAETSPTAATSPTQQFTIADLLTNDTACRNLASLAKLGLGGTNSAASTITRSNKVSPMQIRCKFGQLGPSKSQFNSPHGFCLGLEEDIIVADTNNHRIQVFEKTGSFKFQFGIPGKDEGQLWYPRKVAVMRPSGKYVVCDRGNERSRMQIFTKNGHFVKKIAIRYIDIVAGLAVSSHGEIVAVDSVSPTVFIIGESGDLLRWFDCSDYMREPSDIAIHGKEFYVCDFKGHNVVVFSEEGHFLRRIGCENLTNFPNGIDISDAGDVLIGDSHGNRFHVAVFSRDGSLISEFECPYVKVSRCCGLKITSEGYVVTLAKNNHHVLVLNTLYIL
ncbi:tripartite motif-containing protein 2 isoform X2 [Aethina tumida]|uniref:tripartite motif-containing protein 2 isoform X2 n=1 Tax=Aethina tumida TaxID=116153 RepID=UPI00096AF10A|nr:tripartite motif-containing protein 2 isoform X2 [Aethina tumida]